MRTRNMFSVALALLVLVQLAACKGEEEQVRQGGKGPLVSVFHVEAKDRPWTAQYQAQASGSRSVEVRARVQGIIEKPLYDEGAFVQEGQLLF